MVAVTVKLQNKVIIRNLKTNMIFPNYILLIIYSRYLKKIILQDDSL